MRCTFRCHKMCVGEIFTKFMHMLQRYLCNKCCIILGRGGGGSNESKHVRIGIKGRPLCEGGGSSFWNARLYYKIWEELGKNRWVYLCFWEWDVQLGFHHITIYQWCFYHFTMRIEIYFLICWDHFTIAYSSFFLKQVILKFAVMQTNKLCQQPQIKMVIKVNGWINRRGYKAK